MIKINNLIEDIFLLPVLGHGRMAESYLATVAFVFGCIYCFPDAVDTSQATRSSLFTDVIGSYLAVPFFLKAGFSGAGVIGVIRGWRIAHLLRFIGAFLGLALWGWYAAKFAAIGALGAVGFPFTLVAVFVCFRVLILSLLGIPPLASPARWP